MKASASSVAAAILSLFLVSGGVDQLNAAAGKPDNALKLRIEAIKAAGHPTTPTELHTWYAEPPPGENAADTYQQAFAAMGAAQPGSPAFLSQNQKVLPLLHQAAALKKCRYPIDLSAGLTATLPHLTGIKKCAQLLEKETFAQATKGRTDLATQSILDGLRLAQSLSEEPLLISQLVRVAAESIMLGALRQALERRPFTDEQLTTLSAALREVEKSGGFARAAVGERCFGIAHFGMPAADQVNVPDANFYLDCLDGYIAAAGQPFPVGLEAAGQLTEKSGEAKKKGYIVSAMLMPALGSAMEKAVDAAARARVARVALAVERFRLTHQNALPETLGQLVPKFLDAVPSDPYDGKPLRFDQTTPKGYAVYSIGKNRTDDGGQSNPPGGSGALDVTFAIKR